MGKNKAAKKSEPGTQTISDNRRARHNYEISDTVEAGIVLLGTEVKSLRLRHVSFSDAYATINNGEAFLIGMQIQPYAQGTHSNHEPDRTRKLLLNRRELDKLSRAITEKGLTLVPMKLYFKNGRVKVLLGLGRGKTHGDKRETIKRRESDREMARAMRRGGR